MRIISGQYGGRHLETPRNQDLIRPTSDKVRGAIFNALHSLGAVEGLRVLDLFCGTGALGLEALSRGAAHCTFIDKMRESLDLAKHNAVTLGVSDEVSAFLQMDATKISEAPQSYDLVFMDPPYKKGLIADTLVSLEQHGLLSDDAVLVIEAEKSFAFTPHEKFTVHSEKLYGDTKALYVRYSATKP